MHTHYLTRKYLPTRVLPCLSSVLETEAMVFTNRIAAIVHGCVHASGGDVNKNIGDAFLSVWKLSEKFSDTNNNNEAVTPKLSSQPNLAEEPPPHVEIDVSATVSDPEGSDSVKSDAMVDHKRGRRRSSYVHHLSNDPDVPDKALRSFVDIIMLLDRSVAVQKYAKRRALQTKLGSEFRIRMGFGLHLGWGIEGAVGSRHKIDATYLSPHVNMSARLEAATKQYGVTMLLTDAMKGELRPKTQTLCRPLDRVTVKGSSRPVILYTYEGSSIGKDTSLRIPGLGVKELHKIHRTFLQRCGGQAAEAETGAMLFGGGVGATSNISDESGLTGQFLETWKLGFEAYVDGRWGDALDHIKRCILIRREDSPCKVLLSYIWNHAVVATAGDGSSAGGGQKVQAPSGWPGYRSLNSK